MTPTRARRSLDAAVRALATAVALLAAPSACTLDWRGDPPSPWERTVLFADRADEVALETQIRPSFRDPMHGFRLFVGKALPVRVFEGSAKRLPPARATRLPSGELVFAAGGVLCAGATRADCTDLTHGTSVPFWYSTCCLDVVPGNATRCACATEKPSPQL